MSPRARSCIDQTGQTRIGGAICAEQLEPLEIESFDLLARQVNLDRF
jgi:hypothetical protein